MGSPAIIHSLHLNLHLPWTPMDSTTVPIYSIAIIILRLTVVVLLSFNIIIFMNPYVLTTSSCPHEVIVDLNLMITRFDEFQMSFL